ncbi:MAG TPA: hypothetical protein VGH99_07485 [Pseudonocardia sp.]|jgi:hypothetical protein
MLALVAAVIFVIALILQLTTLSLGVLTADVLVTAGLICVALHLAGIGGSARRFGRR